MMLTLDALNFPKPQTFRYAKSRNATDSRAWLTPITRNRGAEKNRESLALNIQPYPPALSPLYAVSSIAKFGAMTASSSAM